MSGMMCVLKMEVMSKEHWRARTALVKLLPRLRFRAPLPLRLSRHDLLTVLNDLRNPKA